MASAPHSTVQHTAKSCIIPQICQFIHFKREGLITKLVPVPTGRRWNGLLLWATISHGRALYALQDYLQSVQDLLQKKKKERFQRKMDNVWISFVMSRGMLALRGWVVNKCQLLPPQVWPQTSDPLLLNLTTCGLSGRCQLSSQDGGRPAYWSVSRAEEGTGLY